MSYIALGFRKKVERIIFNIIFGSSRKSAQCSVFSRSRLRFDTFFGKIVGATDAPNDKPAPDPVHMAMGDSSASQYENLWFVGDSVVDIQCARNVGATAILIGDELTGHSETQNSATLSPDWHFADCEALVRVVKGFSKVL